MGGSAATAAASSAAAAAAGGAFSESAGDPAAVDPAAVDPFASRVGGGFACPVSTSGAAGAATVVWGAAAAAGVASVVFATRVELCEKASAALTTGAGATSVGKRCVRDVICHVPEFRGGS